MTRFRGMISTQPGSTPVSSFKILALDECDGYSSGGTLRSDCGKRFSRFLAKHAIYYAQSHPNNNLN